MDFWEIYDRYYDSVRSFIDHMIGGSDDSEDLTQETFLKVRDKFDQLRDSQKMRSWLFRIARNQCVDYFRINQSTKFHKNQDCDTLIGTEEISPLDRVARREMTLCIKSKLMQLSEQYRTVLVLFDVVGMSHSEIAEVLEITENNAKVRLHRSRKEMKSILESGCTFERDKRNVFVCLPKE